MSIVLKGYGPVVGRILVAPLFLLSGFHKVTGFVYVMAMGSGPFSLRKESGSSSAH